MFEIYKYLYIQLWNNAPKEVRNSISLPDFKESIKKVPLISCSCNCCKRNTATTYLFTSTILVPYIRQAFRIFLSHKYIHTCMQKILENYYYLPLYHKDTQRFAAEIKKA